MDMAEIDHQLLEQFFEPARKQQVDDNGFTERVMRRLPDGALRLSHYWTIFCIVVAVVLFFVFNGWQPLVMGINALVRYVAADVHPVPFFMAMGVLSCLALIELVHRLDRTLV